MSVERTNFRKAFRAGFEREVWDEYEDGVKIRTAVWEITDRSGRQIGQQSWDEFEEIYEASLKKKQMLSKYEYRRNDPEYRRKRREQVEKNKYTRMFGKRDAVMEALNSLLDERELIGKDLEIPVRPLYYLFDELYPHLQATEGCKALTIGAVAILLSRHKMYFENAGFVFTEGFSRRNRLNCLYVGYKTDKIIYEYPKGKARIDGIKNILELIPVGEYTKKDFYKLVVEAGKATNYPSTLKQSVLDVIIRNSHKLNVSYDVDNDKFIKK